MDLLEYSHANATFWAFRATVEAKLWGQVGYLVPASKWIPSPSDIEPVRLLKFAAIGSQVATSGVDLEIPSGPPWIKRTPLPGAPTVDKRCSTVHRGVSHDGRFVVEVSEIRSEMVIQAPRHKI